MIVKLWERVNHFLRSPFAEHSFWMVGGQGGQAAISFFANLVLVRFLSPSDFGLFALILASIGVAAATLGLRIHTVLLQATEEELRAGGKTRYLSALGGETLIVCLSSLTLLWLFGLLNMWAIVLLANTLIEPWISAQRVLYERTFQYKNLSLIETGSHFLGHLFSVFGVIGGLGPAVLYLRGWVQSLGHLTGLFFVGGLQRFRVRWLRVGEWKSVLRQIRGYWLEGWLEQSIERLVIVFLGFFEGPQVTGYFFQARRLAVTPQQLFQPVSSRILFNFLSHRVSAASGSQVLKKVLQLQIPLLIFLGVTIAIAADPIIPWIFGPGWDPVIPIFQGLVGVLIGVTPFQTLGSYFKAQNHMWPFIVFGQGFQYFSLAVASIIIISLNFSAAYGMAVALSVGYLGGCFVVAVAVKFMKPKFLDQVEGEKD